MNERKKEILIRKYCECVNVGRKIKILLMLQISTSWKCVCKVCSRIIYIFGIYNMQQKYISNLNFILWMVVNWNNYYANYWPLDKIPKHDFLN